jgi:hypothetical protein
MKKSKKVTLVRERPELFSPRRQQEPTTAISKFLGYYAALYVARLCDSHYPKLRPHLEVVIARLSPARHSDDFISVSWFGVQYFFTPLRARIVKVLWQHWEAGTPVVGARHLAAVGCGETQKISDILKDDPAYGTMIQTDGSGKYWLQPPADRVILVVRWVVGFMNRLLGRSGLSKFTCF